jgi:multidrug resistance protein, MATE family
MNETVRTDTSVRTVFNLAWPVMISMLSYTAMSVVDTLFVSRLGTEPLAAVGLASILVFFSQSFGAGLMGGVRVLVSQATGASDHHAARRFGWQGLWLALPLGVAMSSLSLLPPSIFHILGATDVISIYADEFFSIRVLGAPLVLINIALSAWFQGRGDTKTPMRSTLFGNAINIGLDPLLIFGWWGFPELGVAGAATATIISLLVQVIYMSLQIRPHLRGVSNSIDSSQQAAIWNLGAPIGVRYMLNMGSFVVFSSMITLVGAVELAAHIIVVRICSVSFLPGHAVGEAVGVLVGQFIGANQSQKCRPVVGSALKLAAGIMVSWGVVFIAIPALLLAPFEADPAVVTVAQNLLMVAAIFQLFDAVVMATTGGLNGAGDTRWVMIASLACAWLIKVPAGYFGAFILELGAVGAWMGFTLELLVLSALCAHRIRGSRWLKSAEPLQTR